ncbi:Protein kinase domain-containing protein [Meloidogyne graminicola]|uniref:Protein kinase domain-containing protein n=1 Tax=Meloidogyne graminicola TaxID=189291 RepID=A0A8S9ZJS1_9BILA|nr:Protein kinase domain-containing protein [Meloidogyne graminicola]
MEENHLDSNKKIKKIQTEEKENDATNSSSISLTETIKNNTKVEQENPKNIFVDNLPINKQQQAKKDFEHYSINFQRNNKFNKEMAEKSSDLDLQQQKNNSLKTTIQNILKSPPKPSPKTNILNKMPWKKQQPLVVIPKRRKHKNLLSKRKGNKGILGSSMRNCVSDPQLYRGFNHWNNLCLENLNKTKGTEFLKKTFYSLEGNKRPSTDEFKNKIAQLDVAAAKLLAVAENIEEDERYLMAASASERLEAMGIPSPNIGERRKNQKENEEQKQNFNQTNFKKKINSNQQNEKQTSSSLAKGTSIRLAQERLAFAAGGRQHTTGGINKNTTNIGKIGVIPSLDITTTCTPSTSTAITVSPTEQKKILIEEIEQINKMEGENSEGKIERKISARRRRIEDLAKIKEELRNTKLPSFSKRKKGKKQKQEELADAQAKSTVDAISAAFHTTTITNNESPQISQPSTSTIKPPTTNSTNLYAAKPPASPSLLARRELNRLANRREPDDGKTKTSSEEQKQQLLSPTLHTRKISGRLRSGNISPNITSSSNVPSTIPLVAVPIEQQIDDSLQPSSSPISAPKFRQPPEHRAARSGLAKTLSLYASIENKSDTSPKTSTNDNNEENENSERREEHSQAPPPTSHKISQSKPLDFKATVQLENFSKQDDNDKHENEKKGEEIKEGGEEEEDDDDDESYETPGESTTEAKVPVLNLSRHQRFVEL